MADLAQVSSNPFLRAWRSLTAIFCTVDHGHPPKPKFALSIGVVGHRPNRLASHAAEFDVLTTNIDAAFEAIAQAAKTAHAKYETYFDAGFDLTIVSALAEGADRIAAHAALKLGFKLDAPLPFPQDVYEGDFVHKPVDPKDPAAVAQAEVESKASVKEFQDLLGHKQKHSVLTLPGRKTTDLASDVRDAETERAYEAVGLTVLGQSDIVLVIWDGKPSAGRGGTTEMIQTAMRAGLPIIYVDANGKAATKILPPALAPTSVAIEAIEELPAKRLDELSDLVDVLVRPPTDEKQRQQLSGYFDEKRNHKKMRPEFPRLMALTGARAYRPTDRDAPNPEKLADEFADAAAKIGATDSVFVLAKAFGWADALGVYFAQTFRGAFIMNFAVGSAAVLIAVVSLFLPSVKWVFVLLEVICIAAVLINTSYGQRLDWHRRWVEPREIAERLRVAMPLWALGTRPSSFSGEEPSWTGWYVRALVRQQGLRSGSLVDGGWHAAKATLAGLLASQCDYHKDITVPRMKSLHEYLERAGDRFFYGTLFVAVIYLAFVGGCWLASYEVSEHVDEIIKHAVVAAGAGFPAIATACYGIRINGDFEGIAHRSERTYAALAKLITQNNDDVADLSILRARARAVADAMLGDVSSWRLVAEGKDLSL